MTVTVARLTALAMLAVLLAAAGGIATGQATPQSPTGNETAAAPGAQLAGVVAVQGVEVRGEVADRGFGLQIAEARSNDTRVAIVAERVQSLRAGTAELRERRQDLKEARRNGTIGPAQFRVEMAALAARGESLATSADRTGAVAAGLDQERLAERGVNVSAIGELRAQARNATGPEAAAIARSIAGADVGRGLSGGPPGAPLDVPPGRNRTTEGAVRPTTNATVETPTPPDGRPDRSGTDRGDTDEGPPSDPERSAGPPETATRRGP